MNEQITRRSFVGGATAAAAFTIVPRAVLGGPGATAPSERITLGAVGIGDQGTRDLKTFLARPVEIVRAQEVADPGDYPGRVQQHAPQHAGLRFQTGGGNPPQGASFFWHGNSWMTFKGLYGNGVRPNSPTKKTGLVAGGVDRRWLVGGRGFVFHGLPFPFGSA